MSGSSPLLQAARLRGRTSGKGTRYMSERLGDVKVVILPNRDDAEGDPVYGHTHILYFRDGSATQPRLTQLVELIQSSYACKTDDTARRLMTVPSIGPVVALAYMAVIDDPRRFDHARDVGTYLGLTPQRYQSGEVDLTGRISKFGDGFLRTCLY
jgi:Transposase IS116/IS110/IS902 family